MDQIWDKVYSNDSAFFGKDPSNFAQICYREFKKYRIKKLLELGCGQGRDTIFFGSNGLNVHAIDSSKTAIESIYQKLEGKNILVKLNILKQRILYHMIVATLMQSTHTCFII